MDACSILDLYKSALVVNKKVDGAAAGHVNSEAGHVDDGVQLTLPHVSQGDEELVADHSTGWVSGQLQKRHWLRKVEKKLRGSGIENKYLRIVLTINK